MRCLALAAAWREKDNNAIFVGRFPMNIAELMRERGFVADALPLEVDTDDVIRAAISHISEDGAGWVVFDSYRFACEHQRAVRKAGARLLVIDDCMHLKSYEADMILNQNQGAGELPYLVSPGCRVLGGPKYALLRPEFRMRAADAGRRRVDHADRVLVTMGGADPGNATSDVIRALSHLHERDLRVTIVVGPANPRLSELATAAETLRHCELLENVRDMAALMESNDFCITAAGSTCWELCCLGTPFATIVIADNQIGVAEWLEGRGLAPFLGRFEALDSETLSSRLRELLADSSLRQAMSARGRALVDGKGAERVAEMLSQPVPHLRPTTAADCRQIWEWTNDPDVRNASFSVETISWADHQRWFKAKLSDPDHLFFIAQDHSGKPLGQIRFALNGADAEVSVSLCREARGKGWGASVIQKGIRHLELEHGVERVHAFIKPGNAASEQTFVRAGFWALHESGGASERVHYMTGGRRRGWA